MPFCFASYVVPEFQFFISLPVFVILYFLGNGHPDECEVAALKLDLHLPGEW